MVKNPLSSAGDTREGGLIPESGRSPGAGNGYPLQYSRVENSVDRGVWQGTIHGIARSGTRLSTAHVAHADWCEIIPHICFDLHLSN